MSLTYPLTLPTSPPGYRSFDMETNYIVGLSASPYTAQSQVYEWPGTWWGLKASLPPMKRADAERWVSFLISLHGRTGTFYAGDPLGATARGIATGTPLVKGASQTGASLITDGWTISKTGILLAGDYIQVGTGTAQRLYKVLKDTNSDGSGNATFDIFPNLRESPADNAAITVASAKGVFRLSSNKMTWSVDVAKTYGVAFEAIEAL